MVFQPLYLSSEIDDFLFENCGLSKAGYWIDRGSRPEVVAYLSVCLFL